VNWVKFTLDAPCFILTMSGQAIWFTKALSTGEALVAIDVPLSILPTTPLILVADIERILLFNDEGM